MTSQINTCSLELNKLLDGGYEKGVITTIYGPGSSGKTNLLLMLLKNASLKKIIFIDTEGNFSVQRLKQLTEDYEKVLDKTIFLKPTNFEEQTKAVEKLNVLLKQNIDCIIIDSITALYRAELREENAKNINNSLASQIKTLLEISRKKEIPILMTAQVYADLENKDQVKITGGQTVKNMSKCLIELKKSGPNRIAVVQKHRSIKEGKSLVFKIVEKGIEEIKKNYSSEKSSTV
jgi:DNA repair protein RadB